METAIGTNGMIASGAAPSTTTPTRGVRVLIVEDEVLIAETVRTKLSKLGYDITGIALSGEEALQVFDQAAPDVVLMDIKLGSGMDGIQTAERLRETRSLPIIFVTAFSDDETIARVKRCSPYGYIIKPFQLNDLRTNIELALHRYQQEQAQRERQAQLQRALGYLQQAFLVTDADGTVLFGQIPEDLVTAERTARLTGRPLDEILEGLNVAQLRSQAAHSSLAVPLPPDVHLRFQPVGRLGISGELQGIRNAEGQLDGLLLHFREVNTADEVPFQADLLNEAYQLHHKAQREWARSLHEGLGQVLSAAKMNLESLQLNGSGADQPLEQSKQLLDTAVGQVRKLTQAVMPNLLTDFGLAPAVESYLRRLAQEDPRLRADILPQSRRYPEVLEYHVYRLVQELTQAVLALPNVSRLTVQLNLDANEESLVLSLRAEPQASQVLTASRVEQQASFADVRSRMRLIQGVMRWFPSPDGAHSLEVEIPIS